MAIYSTSFSGANENPISESGIWIAGAGNMLPMQVQSGAAMASGISATNDANQARLETPTVGSRQYARGVIGTEGIGGSLHLHLRIQSNTNGSCYATLWNVASPGSVLLAHYNNAAPPLLTTIGSQVSITPSLANGATLEFRAVGSTLIALADGTVWLIAHDTTLTGGQPGFGSDSSTAVVNQQWDAWDGGDLPAVSVNSLGATFNTTSGTKTVTGTPDVGDLIIIITAHSANTSATAPTDNNAGGGGTYTQVESRVKVTSADRMQIFIRDALITSATSTVFTHAPGTSSGGGLTVLKVSGMTAVGVAAKLQSGGVDNVASGTPTMTWTGGGSSSGSNPVISAVFNTSNAAGTMVKPTAFDTKVADLAYTATTNGLGVATDEAGFTGTTVTWGFSSATAFCVVALELSAPTAGPGATSLVFPNFFPRALLVR